MRNFGVLLAAAASAALIGWSASIQAEEAPHTDAVTAPSPAPPKTGKERLSDKASDEQRVDNCKVPAERQGTKVRPGKCAPTVRTAPPS